MRRLAWLAAALLAAGGAASLVWLDPLTPPTPPLPPTGPHVVWAFEAEQPGGFVAPVAVTPQAVYAAASHNRGLRRWGAVYALDPATGHKRWEFTDDFAMLPPASAPVAAGGRLYVGEGMHAHFACHVYCLDPASGAKLWAHPTADHVEATPTVAGGRVYASAGNDGVYCLDAETGAVKWHRPLALHVDASPCVADGAVYVGSGPSRRYKDLRVVCLDAETGHPRWGVPVPAPAWGSPRAAGGRVLVGLGNGRLNEPAKPPESPAGGVACLDAATGAGVWTVRTEDAVFQQPTVDGEWVYFGSRDGYVYCVRAADGGPVFRVPMGGPVIAPPAVAGGKVFAVTVPGVLKCLDPDGREVWSWDLADRAKCGVSVFAAPRVDGDRVYVAAELDRGGAGVAVVYCLGF